MKFLAFTDMHASMKAYAELKKKVKNNKPDFVVCAGDFTFFHFNVEKILKDISKLHERVYIVHGNHEDEEEARKICRKFKSLHFIHKKVEIFNGISVIGYGGGGFAMRDAEFERWSKKLPLNGKKLFVAHAPFYNTALDDLGEHLGNKSYTDFIRKNRIDIGICGHFHENFGKQDAIKSCKVYNPGPKGRMITI